VGEREEERDGEGEGIKGGEKEKGERGEKKSTNKERVCPPEKRSKEENYYRIDLRGAYTKTRGSQQGDKEMWSVRENRTQRNNEGKEIKSPQWMFGSNRGANIQLRIILE
jgi:hypothetical protein